MQVVERLKAGLYIYICSPLGDDRRSKVYNNFNYALFNIQTIQLYPSASRKAIYFVWHQTILLANGNSR